METCYKYDWSVNTLGLDPWLRPLIVIKTIKYILNVHLTNVFSSLTVFTTVHASTVIRPESKQDIAENLSWKIISKIQCAADTLIGNTHNGKILFFIVRF